MVVEEEEEEESGTINVCVSVSGREGRLGMNAQFTVFDGVRTAITFY